MSLLDWFAGQSLAVLIADRAIKPEIVKVVACECYDFAEAMLAESAMRREPC